MRKVSLKSRRTIPSNVASIAIRRSQSDFERASLVRGALLRSRSQPPTICARRTVHEIPVVDEPGVCQVETVDFLADRFVAALERIDQQEQRQRSFLVDWRMEQLTTSSSGAPRHARQTVRRAGTLTPMKRSPSPYSPGAVLKNPCRIATLAGFACARSWRLIAAAVMRGGALLTARTTPAARMVTAGSCTSADLPRTSCAARPGSRRHRN